MAILSGTDRTNGMRILLRLVTAFAHFEFPLDGFDGREHLDVQRFRFGLFVDDLVCLVTKFIESHSRQRG